MGVKALVQHEQTAGNTARVQVITDETINLTSTITPSHEPAKNIPVTSTPFTKVKSNGACEPVKFFQNKPGQKAKPPKNPRATASTSLNATSLVAGVSGKDVDEEPEFGSFFNNPVFDQRFGLATIFTDLELAVHPLCRPEMTPSELVPIMKSLNPEEKESINDEHMAQLRTVIEGIRQVMSCVNRIFMRPHDPTLRTIALGQPPYHSILQSSPGVLPKFVEPILNALGFETRQGGSGVLVQMKDDLYLRDGMKALVQHLKAVSDGDGPVASLGKQVNVPRPSTAPQLDSSDDDDEVCVHICALNCVDRYLICISDV